MTVTLVYSRSSRTTLYPPSMLLQDIDRKELQKKGEDDSITWPTYAVENLVIIESVIQDMVQQKGKLPIQLLKMANVILETSSGINVIILPLCPSVLTNNALFPSVNKEPQGGFRTTFRRKLNFGRYPLPVIHRRKSEVSG
jgi:hypothetical protein